MRLKLILLLLFNTFLNFAASDSGFYNINDIFGISVRQVFSICKDNNDFIWGASKTGVIRISGNDLRHYPLTYGTTDNYFTRITRKDSLLIAYTNNGQFFKYDQLHDCFYPMMDMRHLLNNNFINLNTVLIDDNECIWVSSVDGLSCIDNNGLNDVIKGKTVQYITEYNPINLIVATSDGIALLNKKTHEVDYFCRYSVPDEREVCNLFYDPSVGLLFVGTISNGLKCYKNEGNFFVEIPVVQLPKQPILAISKNSKTATLLIGIDGQGVWELTENGEKIINVYKEDVNDPYSLHGDGVYDIFTDDDERIWVATYTGGISYMDRRQKTVIQMTHQINQPNSLVNNFVNKVIEDSKGDLWFATNAGVSRWDRDIDRWYSYLENKEDQAKVFLAVCEDRNGTIWAGTYSSGVYRIDGKTGKTIGHYFEHEDEKGVSGRFISDLYCDSQGNIWMGGTRNIICYIEKEKKFRIYDRQPIYAFEEFSDEKMLIACPHGLLSLDKITGKYETLLNNVLVQDLVIIEKDIWIATSGAGLIKYDYVNKTIDKYTAQSGLLSNYVNSMLLAGSNLWLGTESGLCRFSLNDKKAYTYSNSYPLSAISFNGNASWIMENGNLLWGTNKGAIMFNPDQLEQNPSCAKIFFQDINVSGSSIRTNEELLDNTPVNKHQNLKLSYKQNNFVLELISTGMNNANTRFSWKMEGIDTDWSQPAERRFIAYTNLPSGQYKLKINMYDSTLSQVIDKRELNIRVVPPFWETWWFRLFIVLTVVGVFFYLLRMYSNNLKQKHTRDKIRFFTNMAHDIRTSLTLISAPIEQLMNATELTEKSRYYLNLAADQSGRLSSVATQLLDFEKVDSNRGQLFPVMTDIVKLVDTRKQIFEATAEKKEIRLEFSSNREKYLTAIDEIKAEKIIDNLISNAIKYSHKQSKVEIVLDCNQNQWSLEVKDYGLGISESAQNKLFKEFYRGDNKANSRMVGSGIGLLLVKHYVTMHNGKIIFDSKENVGSSFKIIIPYCQTSEMTEPEQVPEKHLNQISQFEFKNDALSATTIDTIKKKNLNLLIVEDNSDLRRFLANSLGEYYVVHQAGDGREAWNMIKKITFHLIISDIMMPDMDGFELCSKIKSTFETSHLPVILLTSLSQKAKQLEGLGLGADDYITKPFDISLLIERIRTIIFNREIMSGKALKLIDNSKQDEPVFANEMNDRFVKRAVEVVNNNISNNEFGKEEFASAMNVSSSLLYQKLKALTGQSPIDFIRAIRFKYAMELLKTNKYTITEVSELCGFSSSNYFSTAFKKHYGKSPIEI